MGQQIKIISPQELLGETLRLKNDGYRLVAISCTNKNGLEMSYSFDKDYDFLNLRLNFDYNIEIESVSCIYPFSYLYENEIKELFGAKINNINVDFKDNLYKTSIKTPFSVQKEGE